MSDANRARPLDEQVGLTPWQRFRVYRKVAEKLRREGRTEDAKALDAIARANGEDALIEGER